MNNERCLIMFVKYPEKGKVKSRLSQCCDENMVVRLYRAFIEDLIDKLSGGDYRFRIAFHPQEREKDFPGEFGDTLSYIPQAGKDLGERMHNAFCQCFSDGFQSVVVIGSDSPDLPQQIIKEAFQSLEDSDAVIGPAYDGGYYLIGFNTESFTPEAFKGIKWGDDDVFKSTMDIILNRAGYRVHMLPLWRDIDHPADIAALINESEKSGFAGSKTMFCLRDYGFGKER